MARGRWRGGGAGTPLVPVLAGCALLLSLAACTFERRADANADGSPALTTEDSVRALVSSLDAARRDGDVAAAVALFDADARISTGLPREAGPEIDWLPPREALEQEASGPVLDLVESQVEFPGPGTALVLNRYVETGAPAGDPGALETIVMVRRDGEWRIRHLHRSFPPPAGIRP